MFCFFVFSILKMLSLLSVFLFLFSLAWMEPMEQTKNKVTANYDTARRLSWFLVPSWLSVVKQKQTYSSYISYAKISCTANQLESYSQAVQESNMAEQVSVLLSNCENDTPPFDDLIKTTLSSLHQSRFHFAIELQQTLDSDKDSLTPIQRLCILCTVHDIGNGLLPIPTKSKKKNSKATHNGNVFRDFLEKHKTDAKDILDDIKYKGQLPLLQQLQASNSKELEDKESSRTYRADVSDFDMYRPLPPFIASKIVDEKKVPMPELHVQFLHTTYPSLRYQWLPPISGANAAEEGNCTDADGNGGDGNDISNTETSKPTTDTLLQKIFQVPLEVEEEQTLLAYCDSTGIGVSSSKNTPPLLTPDNLPLLVEHNPNVAIELLMKIQNENQAAAYHSKLVDMEITLHTMEVVYRLATVGAVGGGLSEAVLKTEYLNFFILGLFERCATSQDRKLVRLVSVFLQNLIQNEIVLVDDFVSHEVQAFCIENSRVREAQALFKLLKGKSGIVKSGNGSVAASSESARSAGGMRGKGKKK